jgi:hypothetical protein
VNFDVPMTSNSGIQTVMLGKHSGCQLTRVEEKKRLTQIAACGKADGAFSHRDESKFI